MNVTAKRVILDLLTAMGPEHTMEVSTLIRGAAVFGIAESNVRVTLARLKRADLVHSPVRGHYGLGPAAVPFYAHLSSWRDREDQVAPWEAGSWLGVSVAHLSRRDRAQSARRDRALRMMGLEPLAAGLLLRPDNLVGGVATLRDQLRDLGLEREAPIFAMAGLDDADEARARALWDVDGLEARYHQLSAELDAAGARLEAMDLDAACARAFTLGGSAIHALLFDPMLPSAIIEVDARRALREAMLRFEAAGRAIWEKLLTRSFGALPTTGQAERVS